MEANEAVEALKQINIKNPFQTEESSGSEEVKEFGENLETEETETAEAVEETEQPETEAETKEVKTEEAEEVGAEDGAEALEIEADELASLLGIKSDQLNVDDEGKITLRAKVDGEQIDANLEQLLNAYQRDANLTNRSKKLAETERSIQSKLAEYNQQTNNFAQQAAAIFEEAKSFVNPYSQQELQELRSDDPAEYAARMEEIRQREVNFNAIVNKAVDLTSQSQSTISEDMKAQYATFLEGERQKVRDSVPEWEKVEQDVVNYASNMYTNEEIGMIADSRLQILLYKAMKYDQGSQQVKQKLTKKIPKITKTGKSPSKSEASLETKNKLRAKLKQSGNPNDAVALLRSRSK